MGQKWKFLLRGMRWYALLFAVVSLYRYEILCTIVVALLLTIILHLGGWKRGEVQLILLVGMVGPIAEAISIAFGAWHYPVASMFNVPLWLFPLWASAALFITRIGKRLGV